MKTNHLKTGVKPNLKTLYISTMPQDSGQSQYKCGVLNHPVTSLANHKHQQQVVSFHSHLPVSSFQEPELG
jgi:hypothetical protein